MKFSELNPIIQKKILSASYNKTLSKLVDLVRKDNGILNENYQDIPELDVENLFERVVIRLYEEVDGAEERIIDFVEMELRSNDSFSEYEINFNIDKISEEVANRISKKIFVKTFK